jgi:putative transposase
MCLIYTEGLEGLKGRSKAHHDHSAKTNKEKIDIILKAKNRYPNWGPKKIKTWLEVNCPNHKRPAFSTIGDIFKRHGMIKSRKERYRTPLHSEPFIHCTGPNVVWSADFKRHFKLENSQYVIL